MYEEYTEKLRDQQEAYKNLREEVYGRYKKEK